MPPAFGRIVTTRWYVYLLHCADGTFYTGITTDPERRLAEHNADPAAARQHNVRHKGAKYTRARQPVVLVWHEEANSRADAARREYVVRMLPRRQKEALGEPLNNHGGALQEGSMTPKKL